MQFSKIFKNSQKINILTFPRAIIFCVEKVGRNRECKGAFHNLFLNWTQNPKFGRVLLGKYIKTIKKTLKKSKNDFSEDDNIFI